MLVPLFMVEEGGLKGKAASFTLENMTRKQGELFMPCWEHNLRWSKDFLKEYVVTKGVSGYGTKMVFSYGLNQGKKLIERCKEDYNYDLPAMFKDARDGKISVAPMPVRLIYKLVSKKKEKIYQTL